MIQADGKERWTKPNEGRLKINVDAACFTDFNKFSFAFITQDIQDTVIDAFSSCRRGQVEPEIVEATGIRGAKLGEGEERGECYGGVILPSYDPGN